MTALCLGPALQAYRDVFGEPPRPRQALKASQLLAILKATEVFVETLPELVLQLALLLDSSADGWNSLALLVSLSISITAAALLMVDAESSVNSVPKTRKIYLEYFGYLPEQGSRRSVLLLSMVLFTGAYLTQAASAIAVALQLFPGIAVAVLIADCGLHHLMRWVEGQW
jgi:hypothetical protein